MLYECKDLGSSICPCQLMATGDCYVCTMGRDGECRCSADGKGSGWGGVCPYAIYSQNGCKAAAGYPQTTCTVEALREYSKELTVLRLRTEAGFGQKCAEAGAFVMMEALGYRVPISVMRVTFGAGAKHALVDLAVQPAGPKSKKLLEAAKGGEAMKLRGPVSGGILGLKKLFRKISSCSEGMGEGVGKRLLVVAKGTAVAPYVNGREILRRACLSNGWGEPELWLDKSKLTGDFVAEYVGSEVENGTEGLAELPCGAEELAELPCGAEGLAELPCGTDEAADAASNAMEIAKPTSFKSVSLDGQMESLAASAGRFGAVMFLASPYHTARFKAAMKACGGVTAQANHAAMCCGEGICGSCSYVDEDGVTVKLCKCMAN